MCVWRVRGQKLLQGAGEWLEGHLITLDEMAMEGVREPFSGKWYQVVGACPSHLTALRTLVTQEGNWNGRYRFFQKSWREIEGSHYSFSCRVWGYKMSIKMACFPAHTLNAGAVWGKRMKSPHVSAITLGCWFSRSEPGVGSAEFGSWV